ncbi:unnamed protein product [Periconia digitata]|uniref:Xylanolytic transcriptional activator regulatory domain-containing protein n=1 Tax=Periconia digitata TaxID=1303443 RepID=A0A9W4XV56_9PLEO|nr:unnamed protein product [Periconia digitata]
MNAHVRGTIPIALRLEPHSSSTDTNERPFSCDCGQRFTRHLFWDPSIMTQDMLPASLFDVNFDLATLEPFQTSIEEPTKKSRFARFSSRLPKLDDIDSIVHEKEGSETLEANLDLGSPKSQPWALENACYERLLSQAMEFSAVLPEGFSIPSHNVLIRCLEKYMRCAHEFLPIIHCATFRPEEKYVELVLAMAALGSRYLFEPGESYELFFLAKAIILERLRREGLQNASDLLFGHDPTVLSESKKLERLQAFILLTELASWADQKISADGLIMAGHAAILARDIGISESDELSRDIDWLTYVSLEERRRTLFATYVISNLHSLAFGSPPLILNHEIGLCIPGYAAQWRSTSAAEWKRVLKQEPRQPEIHFQDRLRCLFNAFDTMEEPSTSSFANYLLLQGLIQEIDHESHSFRTTASNCTGSSEDLERALRRWQVIWERMKESSYDSELDPLYSKGPFALTSAALFRLAHIRLATASNLSKTLLMSRDPRCMLQWRDTKSFIRSSQVHRAVIHAAHSLSVPVRLGISFMKTTKTAIWSLEHSICSLESALFLKHWLDAIAKIVRTSGLDALQKVESQMLVIIKDVIKGTAMDNTLLIHEEDPALQIESQRPRD